MQINLRILIFFSCVLVLASGCQTSLRTVDPVVQALDFPPLGEEVERELGDTLIDYGELKSLPAIQTRSSLSQSAW